MKKIVLLFVFISCILMISIVKCETTMNLCTYDFSHTRGWGSDHPEIEDVYAYTGMTYEDASSVVDFPHQWYKFILRIEIIVPDTIEYDVELLRITDFKVVNCEDVHIYPRYSRLSANGNDTLEVSGGESTCIYVEALGKADNEAEIPAMIQSMDFWCNLEYDSDTNYRYKIPCQIICNKATRLIENEENQISVKINAIRKVEGISETFFQNNKMATPLCIIDLGITKNTVGSVYDVHIVTDDNRFEIIDIDNDNGYRVVNLTDDKAEDQLSVILATTEWNDDNDSIPTSDELCNILYAQYSTEFYGDIEIEESYMNGAKGILFRAPIQLAPDMGEMKRE